MKNSIFNLYRKIMLNEQVPLNKGMEMPPIVRIKSQNPSVNTVQLFHATDFNPKEFRKEMWNSSGLNIIYVTVVSDPLPPKKCDIIHERGPLVIVT